MKTALIKTEFWQDDDVFALNSDTRYVYLCLLTNPQRDTTPAFKCGDRMLSAYTGYSPELLNICRKQLIEAGKLAYIDGYYIFNNQDYVKPSKGRDTKIILDRYMSLLPESVINYINNQSVNSSCTSSCTTTRVKDKDNNKDIVKVNNSNTEIDDIFSLWEEIVGYKIESNVTKNRYACNNLLKKHGKDKFQQLLRGVAMSQEDKFAPRISDFISLQSKLSELLAWGKRQSSTKTKGVVRV